jgi:hypothetical protein
MFTCTTVLRPLDLSFFFTDNHPLQMAVLNKLPYYLISFVIFRRRTERRTLDVAASRSRHSHRPQPAPFVQFTTELNALSVSQTSEALRLNGSLVDKNIAATIVRLNKSKSLDGVKPARKRQPGMEKCKDLTFSSLINLKGFSLYHLPFDNTTTNSSSVGLLTTHLKFHHLGSGGQERRRNGEGGRRGHEERSHHAHKN